ncbi:PAS domain S-box/diguanylate cyclase (GGDEF) domain-containing protein [Desulfocapsa sulfexigens DSM 10523]|uniref:PAS domain S-box/diguanylate cyclase (GGDEF) domain-containing protein n=1 Tax=Desulfocapsa sulfexigens (strain DSM 10523 / SB164P1) TaxID=1167006 RepID=M1NE36_DESSD|nr:EAL domain-containing protein [Desulfocapsa sulfexigens]AGF77959.1 PAS domain S-box/diguanylate cyclase (GGDEF) domain-containing protein [Desulfocapsa sulfexigens DSM 10523]
MAESTPIQKCKEKKIPERSLRLLMGRLKIDQNRYGIKKKLIFVICLFLTVLLGLIALFTSYYFRQATRTLLLEQQTLLVSTMAHELDEYITSTQDVLVQFSKKFSPTVFADPQADRNFLENHDLQKKLFSYGLFLLDDQGTPVFFNGKISYVAGPEFFSDIFSATRKSNKPCIFMPKLCPVTQHPIVIMTALFYDKNGKVKGVVGGVIDLLGEQNVFSNLLTMKIGKTGYPYLFAPDRTMILHPVASRIMKKDVEPGKNILFDRALTGFEGAGETVNSRGLHTFVAFKHLESTGWILAINYPVADAFSSIRSYFVYFLVGMITILLLSTLLALRIADKIIKPLLELTAQAEKISRITQHSTLTTDLTLFQQYSGEIGTLATAFNTMLQQLQQRMSEFELNLQVVFDHTDKGIIIHDQEGRILAANLPAQHLFDCDESTMSSLTVLDLSAESVDKHAALSQIIQRIQDGETLILPWRCQRLADRSKFDAEIYYTPIIWNNEPVLMGMIEDITEKKEQNALIHRLSTALEQSANVIVITDRDGVIEYVNPSMEEITGYSVAEVIGKTPRILKSGTHPPEFYEELWATIKAGKSWRGEICNKHKDGHFIWESTVITPIIENQKITHFVAIKEDISQRKIHEQELYRQANYDKLTGLPNRNLLNTYFNDIMADFTTGSEKLVLMLMDLDDFKTVNDSLGHSVGDSLLQAVGERLKDCIYQEDMLVRMGGDEFVIVPRHICTNDHIEAMASHVLDSFIAPFDLQEQEVFITASIGIAVFPEDGETLEELLRNVDSAMYQSKNKGRNTVERYSGRLSEALNEKLRLTAMLRRALEQKEYLLYYQPQQELATGKVECFEALLRWQPQSEAMIFPDKFIPILEETGMIVSVGEWVLREVCFQVTCWQTKGIAIQHASVNVSLRQFQRPDIVKELLSIVTESGVDPSIICLELTESIMMDNFRENLHKLQALRTAGFSVSIDDFGTGYSSLNYLRRMQIQELKIDRSFINALSEDTTLVNAILGMARGLGLRIVAEGVETEEQKSFLRAHNCEFMQGYLLSRPLPAEQFEAFILSLGAATTDNPQQLKKNVKISR